MIIIHCLKEATWERYKDKSYYGEAYLELDGFIHCSEVSTYPRVVSNFKDIKENLVILMIDTEKVEAEIKWEDGGNCGVAYPHIYGLLNTDAVVGVLPHLWDENRNWIVNEELKKA